MKKLLAHLIPLICNFSSVKNSRCSPYHSFLIFYFLNCFLEFFWNELNLSMKKITLRVAEVLVVEKVRDDQ